MIHTSHLLTVESECRAFVDRVTLTLEKAGFQVVRTFDLQAARAAHSPCTCPHHGRGVCNCQMIMLLVYAGEDGPVTLVANSQDGWTQISWIDDPALEGKSYLLPPLTKALSPESLKAGR